MEMIKDLLHMVTEDAGRDTEAIQEALAEMVKDEKARHKSYKVTVGYAEEMAPHAFGVYPRHIIERKRPNEHPEIKKYREDSYERITEPEFGSAVMATKRIFTPGFYSIVHPQPPASIPKDHLPVEYFEKGFTSGKSVMRYAQNVLLPYVYGDPNAVLVMMPRDQDVEGAPFEPVPMVYGSDRVFYYEEDKVAVILTEKKSWINKGKDQVQEGKVFLVIYPNEILKASQYGTPHDLTFEIETIYQVPLGELPVTLLGGRSVSHNGKEYYKSFFDPAIPFWNKAIEAETELDGIYIQAYANQRVLLEIPCNVCMGSGSVMGTEGSQSLCKACAGTGSATKVRKGKGGPYTDFVINPNATDIKPSEAIFYPSPPSQIVEAQEKREAKWLTKAAEKLFVDVLNKVGTNQSGIAKAYDRDGLYTMLQEISECVFAHVAFMYRIGVLWRYMPMFAARGSANPREDALALVPEIRRPFNFQITELGDLISTRQAAVSAGVPDCVIRGMDSEISLKSYGPGSVANARAQAEIALNPYGTMGEDEYLSKRQNGMIIDILDFISTNIGFLVDEAIQADPAFLMRPLQEQRATIKALAEEYMPEKPKVQVLPGMGQ